MLEAAPDHADRFPLLDKASVSDAIAELARAFRAAGLPTAELDARMLVQHGCGLSREALILNPDRPLLHGEADRIGRFATRRLKREPVSRIIGWREFWGHRFSISSDVLDPRPDTETLVEAALETVREDGDLNAPLRILDLGTGSGCILLSLLSELPNAVGVGSDISKQAIANARDNAAALSLADRASFVCADWCNAFSGSFDLILSNPPYIRSSDISALSPEVYRYDPWIALDGEADGLAAFRKIRADVFRLTREGSAILMEVGADQADEIIALFIRHAGDRFALTTRVHEDLAGFNRVVAIKRQREDR